MQRRIIGVFASDGNWQGLVAYYQGKLQTVPNDSELIGLLASAYIENQQRDEGIAAYRKGLELTPADTALRLEYVSRSSETPKNLTRQRQSTNSSVKVQPDNLDIYRELGGIVYPTSGNENRAKTTYQRMIDRDPGNAKYSPFPCRHLC